MYLNVKSFEKDNELHKIYIPMWLGDLKEVNDPVKI